MSQDTCFVFERQLKYIPSHAQALVVAIIINYSILETINKI